MKRKNQNLQIKLEKLKLTNLLHISTAPNINILVGHIA